MPLRKKVPPINNRREKKQDWEGFAGKKVREGGKPHKATRSLLHLREARRYRRKKKKTKELKKSDLRGRGGGGRKESRGWHKFIYKSGRGGIHRGGAYYHMTGEAQLP